MNEKLQPRRMFKKRSEVQVLFTTELSSKFRNLLKHSVKVAKEKGGSNLFTTLPITKHSFSLNKGASKNAICLQYG